MTNLVVNKTNNINNSDDDNDQIQPYLNKMHALKLKISTLESVLGEKQASLNMKGVMLSALKQRVGVKWCKYYIHVLYACIISLYVMDIYVYGYVMI